MERLPNAQPQKEKEMKKCTCSDCKTEWIEIPLCPKCGRKNYTCSEVNEQVHPVMRNFLNMAVEKIQISNYFPNCHRDALD